MNEKGSNQCQLIKEIKKLKEKRNAVIMAHYYEPGEIQDIADFVGDSLQLARQAAETDAEVIVFCGVHFMAESAAILSPNKIVLLPEAGAGCPMADMIDSAKLIKEKEKIQGVQVVCYVNSSAEVKAESDICCTSANAEMIVKSLPDGEILFVPDSNLGGYVAKKIGKKIHLWNGHCPTHHNLRKEDVLKQLGEHPNAKVLVHPECREEVWREADFVGSTAGIIAYAKNSADKEFIIGTEKGILHQLKKECPDKKFYMASEKMICLDMKKISLEMVRDCLQNLNPRVEVSDEIRNKAVSSLQRMLVESK
ncbi:MAG: quinolinate synthase NadA [Eubacteriales bacterium]